MKIIKHGFLAPRYFRCNRCYCEFVATIREYKIAASGDNFFVMCPECQTAFDQHAPLYEEEES